MTHANATSAALEQRVVDTIRTLSIDAVQAANSGHPGMPMGCADFATVLWARHLRVDPAWPEWPGRDRFVLSAGHGSMLLYSMLHLSGFDLPLDEIRNFRQWHSKTPGHPEFRETAGVETTTGPLGQGLANAVGLAMAERFVASRFPDNPDGETGHFTYVLAGDGDLMEGVAAEAASLAGHLQLGRLIVFYDSNDITIDGGTHLSFREDVGKRFAAQGWHVVGPIDGHDRDAIDTALIAAKAEDEQPTLIIGRTHIAHGSPNFEGSEKSHGAPLGADEVALIKKELGFDPAESFVVPSEVQEFFAAWREERAEETAKWKHREQAWRANAKEDHDAWAASLRGELPADLLASPPQWETGSKVATRGASGEVVQELGAEWPELLTGSADLFGSNKTNFKTEAPFAAPDYSGRNVFYGIREHAMGSIANGLALHGGVRPVGSTFLVFADYMRPPIRLAALMKLPVIHVFTHDSVYVGEDGPTHQPIEHLDSLRIIPDLHVVRPADANETVTAWKYAAERTEGPTILVFTRQGVPVLDPESGPDSLGLSRAVRRPEGAPAVNLLASGSEVSLCLAAAEALAGAGVEARVLSIPCLEEFAAHGQAAIRAWLGTAPRLAVEAGPGHTWRRWIREEDDVHGIDRFGASAPGAVVAEKLGLSADAVAASVRKLLARA